MKQPIPFFSLARQWEKHKAKVSHNIDQVLKTQHYVGGEWVAAFEADLSSYVGTKHAIGCNSGTDALWLALKAIGLAAHEIVLTTPFSFIASSSEIIAHGAHPVYIDIDETTYNISPSAMEKWLEAHAEKAGVHYVEKTTGLPIRGIVAVNIFGQCANYTALRIIAQHYNLWIVEDAAQSIGATHGSKQSGALGDIATFSFYPTKNLGAFGDGGAVTTHSDQLADRVRALRNHGRLGGGRYAYTEHLGINSRIDALQAAVLCAKLPVLATRNARRAEIASYYDHAFKDTASITTPCVVDDVHTYHQYSVRVAPQLRNAYAALLQDHGVGTAIFYPEPFTSMPQLVTNKRLQTACPVASAVCSSILSLPIWPELTNEEVETVSRTVKACMHTMSTQTSTAEQVIIGNRYE